MAARVEPATESQGLPTPTSLLLAASGVVAVLIGWDGLRAGLRHGLLPWPELGAFLVVGWLVGIAVTSPILLLRRELLARVLRPERHPLRQILVAALDVTVLVVIAAFESLKTASDGQRAGIVVVAALVYCAARVLCARHPRLARPLALLVALGLIGVTELLAWRIMDRTRCALDLFAVGLAGWAVAVTLRPARRVVVQSEGAQASGGVERLPGRWGWVVLLLLPLLIAMQPSVPQSPSVRAWLHHQSTHARSLRYLLVPLLDWDRDGAPVALGGSDCAPWDPSVYPGAHEQPGNGRDDNCLGGDGVLSRGPSAVSGAQLMTPRKHDVILLSLDALRFDATDALAQTRRALGSHAVFRRAVSPAPQTIDSLPATLRGRPLRQLQMSRHPTLPIQAPVVDRHPTLGTVLVRHGYRAVAVPTHRYLDPSSNVASGFEQALTAGFARVRRVRPGLGKANPIVSAAEALAELRKVLRATPGPVLLWAHLMDTHHPYYWGEHQFGPNDVTGYRRALVDLDRRIARFLREVRGLRNGREPLVVLWGDHGEEFGEHGARHHATSVYAEQARVGFLIGGPGVPAVRYDGPVSTTALPATVLELLELPAEASFVDPSVLPCAAGRPALSDCPEVAVSELHSRGRFVIAYTSRTHRLLWDPVYNVEALFDSQRDPYEQTNLAATEPAALAKLRSLARRWDERH